MADLRSEDLKRVITRFYERLTEYRHAIDELNVYPVPDGDTGTNMALTVGSVVEALDGARTMTEVARAVSHGSLMGARGNSGVILSQILRGMTEVIDGRDVLDVAALAEALRRGSDGAYGAVMRPVEGTILTVAREAADAAAEAATEVGDDLGAFWRRVYDRAVDALRRTPEMLPVLAQAGVVDAGGAGLLLLLAAFCEIAGDAEVELPEQLLRAHAHLERLEETTGDPDVADLRYEVMFFLDADDEGVERLRRRWAELGGSIVVVGGGGTYNCHIHTDHIGPAIEAAVEVGRPRDIRVTDLQEEVEAREHHRPELPPEIAAAQVGVVAVAAGEGLMRIFRSLGAQAVVGGGQSMNPSTLDLLETVEHVPAAAVVLLPDNKNIVPVARQIADLTSKPVQVVPTRSVPEGLAAMFGYDPSLRTDDPAEAVEATAEAMAAAAADVRCGEVTRAVRDATVDGTSISEGDYLALVDGAIVGTAETPEGALRLVVDELIDPVTERLTLYVGAGIDRGSAEAAVAGLGLDGIDVEILDGGQPLYPYLVAVE